MKTFWRATITVYAQTARIRFYDHKAQLVETTGIMSLTQARKLAAARAENIEYQGTGQYGNYYKHKRAWHGSK